MKDRSPSSPLVSARARSRCRPAVLAVLLLAAGPAAVAEEPEESSGILADDHIGVPLRLQDFTFPNHLVLGFAPMPAAPLGDGNWAAEIQYSRVNFFQASPAAEEALAASRPNGERRGLDAADVEAILALPEGDAYFLDGEMGITDINFFYGVNSRVDIGIGIRHLEYTGGNLDGTIWDFHDQFGYGQQGRQYVPDDRFQFVFGSGELEPLVVLGLGPDTQGFSDPTLRFRYAYPRRPGGWRFALSGGIKIPFADQDGFFSTGSVDYGLSWIADKRWTRTAFILNLSLVAPGDFEQNGFSPPLLPSIHLSWLRRFQRWESTRIMLQIQFAEHPLRDLVDSELTEGEFMATIGMKWATPLGVVGFGLTENLLNYDNTPDIGLHFTWGFLGTRGR